MYPIEVPDSLLELADVTRPDHLEVGDTRALAVRIERGGALIFDWANDERFWEQVCQEGFAQTLGNILPHVTNGEMGLAALIQSRTEVAEDPALRARKAVTQILSLLADYSQNLIWDYTGMDGTSRLVQILGDMFTAACGGLVMSANLVSQGYPISVHSGVLNVGAKTILEAEKSLKQHFKNFNPVVY